MRRSSACSTIPQSCTTSLLTPAGCTLPFLTALPILCFDPRAHFTSAQLATTQTLLQRSLYTAHCNQSLLYLCSPLCHPLHTFRSAPRALHTVPAPARQTSIWKVHLAQPAQRRLCGSHRLMQRRPLISCAQLLPHPGRHSRHGAHSHRARQQTSMPQVCRRCRQAKRRCLHEL